MKTAIQKLAPHFEGMSYFNNNFKRISLKDYQNQYAVLFFYPLNFTFVCPTEIIQFSNKAQQFREKLNCEVIGCSVDSHYSHMEYANKPRAEGGLGGLNIPLLSDQNHQISRDYGVLLDAGIALRGTFIIDNKQILRHISINDLPVGRNVDEIYRLVQGFQYADKHGEVCPASWRPGDSTMVPNHEKEITQKYWKDVHSKK